MPHSSTPHSLPRTVAIPLLRPFITARRRITAVLGPGTIAIRKAAPMNAITELNIRSACRAIGCLTTPPGFRQGTFGRRRPAAGGRGGRAAWCGASGRGVTRQAETQRAFLLMAPGCIRTALGGPDAPFTVEEGVQPMVDILLSRLGTPGLAYLDRSSPTMPWYVLPTDHWGRPDGHRGPIHSKRRPITCASFRWTSTLRRGPTSARRIRSGHRIGFHTPHVRPRPYPAPASRPAVAKRAVRGCIASWTRAGHSARGAPAVGPAAGSRATRADHGCCSLAVGSFAV